MFNKQNQNVKAKSGIFLSFIIGMLILACNSNSKNESRSDLYKEMEDVKEELSEIISSEKKEAKAKLDSVINDFNSRIEALEDKAKKADKKIDSKTEELINELKLKRDKLQKRRDKIEEQTEKSWKEFRKEMEHDLSQFISSVKDFFKDNE